MRFIATSVLAAAASVSVGWASPPACPANSICENHTYDAHGRLTQVVQIETNGSGTIIRTVTVVYTYDDAGNRTQKTTTIVP